MRTANIGLTAAALGMMASGALTRAQDQRTNTVPADAEEMAKVYPNDGHMNRQARRFKERKGYDRADLYLYRPHKWALNPKPKWIPGYSEAGRRALRAQGLSTRPDGWVR